METLILIDGDFIPYYICYVRKDSEPKTLEQTKAECNKLVWDILVKTKATHYIGFLGVKGTDTFRHKTQASYKANRKPTTSEEFPYFRECRKHLIDFWNFVFTPSELEVDDCLVITKNRLQSAYSIVTVSPDKDLLQLEGRHYNPRKHEWVDRTFMREEAVSLFWRDMLTGQPGDNIPGIPNMGPVKATKYLMACPSYSSIEELEVNLASHVLKAYIMHFGLYSGIKTFEQTFTLLKILEESDLLVTPRIQCVDLEQLILSQVGDDPAMENR